MNMRDRRFVIVQGGAAVLTCIALWVAIAGAQQGTASPPPYVDGEILVKFQPQASTARRNAVLSVRAAQLIRRFDALDLHHIRLPQGLSVEAALSLFQAQSDVLFAQPNYIRQAVAPGPPNDPYWLNDSLWGLQRIMAQPVWVNFTTGNGTVVVADIDTGVNYNHPDLAANMWHNPGEIPGNGIDDDGDGYIDDRYGIDVVNHDSDPMDDHGHGTHTAGTIGAAGNDGVGVVGVNWNVKILACKFLAANGNGTDAGAIACFNYIVALRNRGINIRVSSNSWGGTRGSFVPQALKSAIDAAGNAGILNVFAAGNDGTNNDVTPFDPASLTSSSIVSVAASDGADNRASFSNYGPTSVDLAAPGVFILSTYGGGYAYLSGTSMAAPHVAGAAALLATENPSLSVGTVKSLLLGNVDRLGPWSGLVASGGRLNVFGAGLAAFQNSPPSVGLTAPAVGTRFVAPATIMLSANASDSDGTVNRVDFHANGTLVGTASSAPYDISWSDVVGGSYTLTAVATDNLGATTTSGAVAITVEAPTGGGVNVAAAVNGATATASSMYGSGYAANGAINGDRTGQVWGNGGGWNDGTPNAFPDWLEVDFAGPQTINEIDVFSVQDTYQAPSEPTPTMTFSLYGLQDFEVQYWTGSAWQAVPGGTVTGNNLVWRRVTFGALTTSRIRIFITQALNTWSRITEVEAYTTNNVPTGVNVAAAVNGATATASSMYGSGYAANGAINGDRTGQSWGNGGGWNDGTPNAFPDWLEVDFAGPQTINEIDVFTVQDNYQAPSEPTATMTFSLYGLQDFEVQYWTGSAWQGVSGGTVMANNLVWRRVTFGALTTSRIRILITKALDTWSRVTEIEAYATANQLVANATKAFD